MYVLLEQVRIAGRKDEYLYKVLRKNTDFEIIKSDFEGMISYRKVPPQDLLVVQEVPVGVLVQMIPRGDTPDEVRDILMPSPDEEMEEATKKLSDLFEGDEEKKEEKEVTDPDEGLVEKEKEDEGKGSQE